MNAVIDALLVGFEQFAVSFRRNKRAALGAEIRPADEHHLHFIAQSGGRTVDILQGEFTLFFKNLVYIVRPRRQRHVPFAHAANPARVLHPRPRNQGDIAESQPAQCQINAVIGVCVIIIHLLDVMAYLLIA